MSGSMFADLGSLSINNNNNEMMMNIDLNQSFINQDHHNNNNNHALIHNNTSSSTNSQTKLCARGHWRPAEDSKLKELVALYGPQNWNLIAEKLEGRSGILYI